MQRLAVMSAIILLALALPGAIENALGVQVVPCEGDCGGEGESCEYVGTTSSCNLCYVIPSIPPILMHEGTCFHYYECTTTLPDGSTYTYMQMAWEGRGCGLC